MKPTRPRPEGRGWVWDPSKQKWFRVRKLTPKSCFRLMGVKDKYIERIQSYRDEKGKPISESQQYKQAGNSIVVDVMYYCFENLFYPKKVEVTEPTLF